MGSDNSKSDSRESLERTRNPHNNTNQEWHTVQGSSASNLYPNLNANKPFTPVHEVPRTVTPVSKSNAYNSPSNGSSGRSEAGEYVLVNLEQQRSFPKPSAPPAGDMVAEHQVRPILTPALSSYNSSMPSTSANTPAQSTKSVSRGRAADDNYNCPTCFQHLGTTIYQYRAGHSSCKVCHQANKACGKCSAPLTDTRNIVVEGIVAEHLLKNKTRCPNAGCSLNFNDLDMHNHLNECPFGETDCPMGKIFGQCYHRYNIKDLVSHFDAFHKDERTADVGKEMFIFNICMDTQKVFLVNIGPYHFLVHVKVSEATRTIYMTVQLFGTAISAKKWTYELHVYNKRQPRRKFTHVDICHTAPLLMTYSKGANAPYYLSPMQ